MAFTEIAVKQAKPKDKAYKLTDAGSCFCSFHLRAEKVGVGATTQMTSKIY